jgi:hypothetical protein
LGLGREERIVIRKLIMLCVGIMASISIAHAAPAHRAIIKTEAQFTELSRTINVGRYAQFPQVMFVIDRAHKSAPRLYFINAKRYEFHIDFVQKNYLSSQSVDDLYRTSYFKADRRFIPGSVVRYAQLGRYGVEFWEGDTIDAGMLRQTMRMVQAAFPKPLAFKPNSQRQRDMAETLSGIAVLDANQIYGSRTSLTLNPGKAVGRLRILDRVEPDTLVARGDILILREVPLQLSPVAGIVTTSFSTPLSHVNLLAKSWRVPNGYLKDADARFATLDGQMVMLSATENAITLRAATQVEIAAAGKARAAKAPQIAVADLAYRGLPSLAEQRRASSDRTGAKAANLGEVEHHRARDKAAGFDVPPGFSVPFGYYDEFVRKNGLDRRIDALISDPRVESDGAWRKRELAALRKAFLDAPFDPDLLGQLQQRRRVVIGEGSVFARSSTNSEDLPGFNGAGLYSSVPNVVTADDLSHAVRTVWSSVWNDTAFEARMVAGIDHKSVKASVLIQQGMNAQAAGVMITENPFDPDEPGTVFINAKRGLGIRVVEGRKVAEQLLYRADPEAIQVLTRSTDDAMLIFDENGGVKEVAVEAGRAVLTDDLARRLAQVGQRVAAYFDDAPQDIEWLTIGDRIYIVQSRPYLRGN